VLRSTAVKAQSQQAPVSGADGRSSWERMLLALPIRNSSAAAEGHGAEAVELTVPRRRPKYLTPLSWLVKVRPTRTIVLDRLGTQIWQSCDGKRTVEQVVEGFAQTHRLSFHEARTAVTGYLRELIERGAMAIVMPPPDDAENETAPNEAERA
jgi:hypothetical protein